MAADPDPTLPDDAVPIGALLGSSEGDGPILPEWYMPAPASGAAARRGWRRAVAIGLVLMFLAINAAGLCSTYGWVEIA